MLFNSYQYLIFFSIVTGLYFLFPHVLRNSWLLCASYFFYMSWEPRYALLILGSTVVAYSIAILLATVQSPRKRLLLLLISVVSNLGALLIFKYFGFLVRSIEISGMLLGQTLHLPVLDLLLPVGISFYTFQTLSYTIDVYLKKIECERKFINFALYASFFPQLLAGPISRAENLLPQFRENHIFDSARVADGLKLICWGLFKKMVIADRLALAVNAVYNHPNGTEGPAIVLATFLYSYQIYCDFSGYSDIAIGSANVLGFNLVNNFDRPYLSSSIGEFWRRWHISLSTWFRDYVYIPLGGGRCKRSRVIINLLIVFFLSGLWHGADFTFIVWGLVHASYLILERTLKPIVEKICDVLILRRFQVVICGIRVIWVWGWVSFAWLFFRANSITDAYLMVKAIPTGWSGLVFSSAGLETVLDHLQLSVKSFLVILILLIILETISYFERKTFCRKLFSEQPIWLRWPVYITLVLAILNLSIIEEIPFIYFQF
jgi:alginate O-acetyltransferase complex protein AlgI